MKEAHHPIHTIVHVPNPQAIRLLNSRLTPWCASAPGYPHTSLRFAAGPSRYESPAAFGYEIGQERLTREPTRQCLGAAVALCFHGIRTRIDGPRDITIGRLAIPPNLDLRLHLNRTEIRRIPGSVRLEAVGLVRTILNAGREIAVLGTHAIG